MIEERLQELGWTLPPPPVPGGNYVPALAWKGTLYLSGVISARAGEIITGTVTVDRTLEEGYDAARECALLQLAAVKAALGSLDAVQQILSVNGYVNAPPGFADSPRVVNGCSDFLASLFGDRGRHVRAAVGVSALPRHALVEVQMTVAF